MKSIVLLTLLTMLCPFGSTLHAQDALTDLYALNQVLNASELSMEVKVYIHRDATDEQGELTTQAWVKRNKRNQHSAVDQNEVITEDHQMVLVDHEEKTLTYYLNSVGIPKEQAPGINLDSATLSDQSISYLGLKDGKKGYELGTDNASGFRSRVYMDAATHEPVQIEYYYPAETEVMSYGAHHMRLVYTKVDQQARLESSDKVAHYVQKRNGTWQATSDYQNYEVEVIP